MSDYSDSFRRDDNPNIEVGKSLDANFNLIIGYIKSQPRGVEAMQYIEIKNILKKMLADIKDSIGSSRELRSGAQIGYTQHKTSLQKVLKKKFEIDITEYV